MIENNKTRNKKINFNYLFIKDRQLSFFISYIFKGTPSLSFILSQKRFALKESWLNGMELAGEKSDNCQLFLLLLVTNRAIFY